MECTFSKQIPHLQKYDIHIWTFCSTLYANRVNELEEVLSKDELERANKFLFHKHHDQFILSRGSLRYVLGHYLQIDPSKIRFSHNSYGKPMIVRELNRVGLSFNKSHTIGLDLLAITLEHSIGIDIEHIRDNFAYEDIAQNCFSSIEVSDMKKLSQPARKEAFFNCWTRKEAFLKATGCGLSTSLDSFDVGLTTNEGAVKLTTRPDPQKALNWSLQYLKICKGYSAALAIQCPINNIFFFDYEEFF